MFPAEKIGRAARADAEQNVQIGFEDLGEFRIDALGSNPGKKSYLRLAQRAELQRGGDLLQPRLGGARALRALEAIVVELREDLLLHCS